MIDESKRKVDEEKVSYNESAEELFTHNFRCPHCKGTLSLSLAKLYLEKIAASTGSEVKHG